MNEFPIQGLFSKSEQYAYVDQEISPDWPFKAFDRIAIG